MLNFRGLNNVKVVLILTCITFNAILAFVNSNFFHLKFIHVALLEVFIIIITLFYCLKIKGFDSEELLLITFLGLVSLSFIFSYLMTGFWGVESFRNFLIFVTFTILGRRICFDEIKKVFNISILLVLIVLLIEIVNIDTYVHLFSPASYFENTRGLEQAAHNEIGVFANALGFEGRFNLGLYSGPRTSSLFLEQVSLSIFMALVVLYMYCFYDIISFNSKILCFSCFFSILLTNNNRLALGISLLFLLSKLFYMKIPRNINYFVLLTSLLVLVVSYYFGDEGHSDTIAGRLKHSADMLFSLSFYDLVGAGVTKTKMFWDAGFAFLIASSNIFVAFFFLVLILSFLKQNSQISICFAFAFSIYFLSYMLIGGNAIYSIKTSPLIWVLFGFFSVSGGFVNDKNFKYKI